MGSYFQEFKFLFWEAEMTLRVYIFVAKCLISYIKLFFVHKKTSEIHENLNPAKITTHMVIHFELTSILKQMEHSK